MVWAILHTLSSKRAKVHYAVWESGQSLPLFLNIYPRNVRTSHSPCSIAAGPRGPGCPLINRHGLQNFLPKTQESLPNAPFPRDEVVNDGSGYSSCTGTRGVIDKDYTLHTLNLTGEAPCCFAMFHNSLSCRVAPVRSGKHGLSAQGSILGRI